LDRSEQHGHETPVAREGPIQGLEIEGDPEILEGMIRRIVAGKTDRYGEHENRHGHRQRQINLESRKVHPRPFQVYENEQNEDEVDLRKVDEKRYDSQEKKRRKPRDGMQA